MNDKTNLQQDDFSLAEWINTPFEQYDNRAAFEAEVQPIIDQLEAKCKVLGLPFMVLTASGQEGDKTQYHMQSRLQGMSKAPGLLMVAQFAGQGDMITATSVLHALNMRRANFAPKPEGVTAH